VKIHAAVVDELLKELKQLDVLHWLIITCDIFA
jgi:hypothetical protein